MDILQGCESLVQESPLTKECYVDTLIGNLKRKQQRAQTELTNVNAALEALQKNPELANVLELISRTR